MLFGVVFLAVRVRKGLLSRPDHVMLADKRKDGGAIQEHSHARARARFPRQLTTPPVVMSFGLHGDILLEALNRSTSEQSLWHLRMRPPAKIGSFGGFFASESQL